MARREWSEHDERLAKRLRGIRRQHDEQGFPMANSELTEYIRYTRKRRWTFDQIGSALGINRTRASKLYKAWQDSYGA